jgi:hypothetical protein
VATDGERLAAASRRVIESNGWRVIHHLNKNVAAQVHKFIFLSLSDCHEKDVLSDGIMDSHNFSHAKIVKTGCCNCTVITLLVAR